MKKILKIFIVICIVVALIYLVDYVNSIKRKNYMNSMNYIVFESSGREIVLDKIEYQERMTFENSQSGYLYFKDNSFIKIEIYEGGGYFSIGKVKPTLFSDGWFYIYKIDDNEHDRY